jgi:hypothetical protein
LGGNGGSGHGARIVQIMPLSVGVRRPYVFPFHHARQGFAPTKLPPQGAMAPPTGSHFQNKSLKLHPRARRVNVR